MKRDTLWLALSLFWIAFLLVGILLMLHWPVEG
jgi:hypothetical protein